MVIAAERSRNKVRRVALVLLAWLGLTLFHGFGILLFAGWVGVADAFIPWSIVAGLLWVWTRRKLGLPALRSSWIGGVVLILWVALFTLAAWGIDHLGLRIPIDLIGITYLAAPVLPMLFIPITAWRLGDAGAERGQPSRAV